MLNRLLTPALRPLLTVLGLAGLLALGACGGGNGAPNNPYVPIPPVPALVVLPASLVAYSGVPSMLTITSGVAPFFAFSENPSTIAVAQNVSGNTVVFVPSNIPDDIVVQMTVQDSIGQIARVNVLVKPSSIFNGLTVVASGGDCGDNLCSGQRGTATVLAKTPTGAPLAGRAIRFDVVFGPFGIATTNPATPLVQTLTVVTDATGTAVVGIQAAVNATTQPAQIRATDVTSGQAQIGNFTIVNNTIPSDSPLTIIPPSATITGGTTTTCSSGFRIDYYIYGGNPPYTVSSTFPTSVTIVNPVVQFSGGFFEAITNGSCVNPLVFTIVDSAGKQVTAQLINQFGTTVPPAPTPVTISPATQTVPVCMGSTVTFVVTGGTPGYSATVSPRVATGPTASVSGAVLTVINIPAGAATYSVSVLDTATPQASATATFTCTS
jgi:hypothetical protein